LVAADVPIASNTSALPISHLQRGRKHPERFLGMHWAEPAHATRFMELIRGEHTSDTAFQAAAQLAKAIGKEPCLVEKDVPAFIANRIGYAMYREALNILEMGVADAETIDRSCRNALGLWATICGPLRWMDLTGGPAAYAKAIRAVLPSLSNATELPKTLQDLVDSDAQGIANGRGFYEYNEEQARQWEELFLEHAWTIRELMNRYFPLEGS
jgi:3-hydroxybutyryl-CoA dehydrogenase